VNPWAEHQTALVISWNSFYLFVPNSSISQNHRLVGVGRDLCGSSSATLLPKQGHLEQAAQDLVQAGLEYLQRRRIHNLPGQSVPVLRYFSFNFRTAHHLSSAFPSTEVNQMFYIHLCGSKPQYLYFSHASWYSSWTHATHTFQFGPRGPRPVLTDLNFAGSSSAL